MIEGSLSYNQEQDRYGLLVSDHWYHPGLHCGECLEVLVNSTWTPTRIEMDMTGLWYLVGTPTGPKAWRLSGLGCSPVGCTSELEGVLLCIKNLANKIKPPCPQCPYTLGQVHTVVNPCPQCRMNGFKTYEQFKKELAGKLTIGV